jgi:hypothetical protein
LSLSTIPVKAGPCQSSTLLLKLDEPLSRSANLSATKAFRFSETNAWLAVGEEPQIQKSSELMVTDFE